ncbi:MAG: preprotein translocase subunit YajC [Isosphaeraceae bacterium]|nr:preprotein translocase subunit YajC [Isosphaeraceae bacterium]
MLGLLVVSLVLTQAPDAAPAAAPAAQPGAAAAPAGSPAPAAGAPAAPGAPAAAAQPSPFSTLIPLLPIPILFYFLMIRPQQQQEKKRREMLGAMQRNDRIVTSGGIHGTIVGLDAENETVTVRIDDDRGVKVVFSKAAIVRIVDPADRSKPEPAKEV